MLGQALVSSFLTWPSQQVYWKRKQHAIQENSACIGESPCAGLTIAIAKSAGPVAAPANSVRAWVLRCPGPFLSRVFVRLRIKKCVAPDVFHRPNSSRPRRSDPLGRMPDVLPSSLECLSPIGPFVTVSTSCHHLSHHPADRSWIRCLGTLPRIAAVPSASRPMATAHRTPSRVIPYFSPLEFMRE